MSLPNSLPLRATHSHQGGHGGHPGGGLGSSVGTRHSPRFGKRSAGILLLRWGQLLNREGVLVRYHPWHIPHLPWSLMFSNVVATSQGHLVSSLSQAQSMPAARKKGDSCLLKGNVTKKKRGKLDTNDGSPQKDNATKKKRSKLDTGYEAAEKRSANTDTKDDAKYNDEEDDLPVGGVPFGKKQQGERRLTDFNTATVVVERRGKNYTKDEAEYNDKESLMRLLE